MSVARSTPRTGRRAGPGPGGRLVEARETLRARSDGSFRLVVVADTHGHPHPAAAERIAAERPDAILHAGDIGDLAVLDALRELGPVVAVRGNIDVRARDLPDAVIVDVEHEERTILRMLLVHIAVYGPKLRADAARLARDRGASLVVCGHSHVPFIGRDRGIVVLNAGSIGPRRFQLPIVFGVVELGPGGLRLHHVDCETGERWEPPR